MTAYLLSPAIVLGLIGLCLGAMLTAAFPVADALCDALVRRHADGRALLCEKPRGHGGFHFHRWEPEDDPRIERDRDYNAELDAEAHSEETR